MRMHLVRYPWILLLAGLVAPVACGSKQTGDLGTGDDGGGGSSSGAGSSGSSSGSTFGSGDDAGGSFGSSSSGGGVDAGPPIPVTTVFVDNCTTGAASGLSAASV